VSEVPTEESFRSKTALNFSSFTQVPYTPIIFIIAKLHIGDTATEAGAAANPAAANKMAEYDELASTHTFYPVATETRRIWNHWAVELVQEVGRRATLITGEPRESTFLFQQLSIAF